MKKILKISYLYFSTGLILCLYSIISQENPAINVHDTYYVVSANNFALFVALIYLILGVLFLVIEKYLSLWIKVLQFLMFNVPFIYFAFGESNDNYTFQYILENPIAYKWKTEYIPNALAFCFLVSTYLFFVLFVIAFFRWRKNSKVKI